MLVRTLELDIVVRKKITVKRADHVDSGEHDLHEDPKKLDFPPHHDIKTRLIECPHHDTMTTNKSFIAVSAGDSDGVYNIHLHLYSTKPVGVVNEQRSM